MSGQPADAALIAESIAQPERFGLVFDRHYHAIHRFASRRLGSAHADDVAAEVFARAFKARRKFAAGEGDALPWLFGIASNVMRMHSRSELRRLRAFARTGVDPTEDFAPAAADRASADQSHRALVEALTHLSRRDREIVLLAAWAELSSAEIGTALGIPAATVRTRLARARRRMAQEPGLSSEIPVSTIATEER